MGLTEKLPPNVRPKIVYTGRKLSSCFKLKDEINVANQHNVIYRVSCPIKECSATYIGECARRLTERAKDHQGCDRNSHVGKHSMENDYPEVTFGHFEIIGILKRIVAECKDGSSAREICAFGDKIILEETSQVYKKEKDLTKGIGFPTCISINNIICHFSPLLSEPDVTLKDGDLVKIDIGVHVDGFIAGLAHTVVVGASKENKITGRKADVLLAAYYAAEIAQRLVKNGSTNTEVTEAISKVAEEFKCKPVEGMLSHQLQQNIIDGDKTIIQNPSEAQRKDHKKCTFELHEVYGVDVLISTGDGKAKERENRTTVYKRTDLQYLLKMKASRNFYSEVCNKFTMMPFTLRAFEDEKKAKLGVNECTNHELIIPYPVLYEKDGEYVAQFKFTVLLMPNGPLRITHGTWDPEFIQSEYSIKDEDLKKILSSQVSKKSQKKKKKKAAAQAKTDIADNIKTSETTPPVPS